MKWGARIRGILGRRRLERLAAAVRAWRHQAATPLTTGLADAQGDAVARLAADIEQMAATLAAQKTALARAQRQQSELLSRVSHHLRTPLASMQGYLELLLWRQGQLDPAEERNYLQTAIRQSENLARRVHDLLELTQLEAEDVHPAAEEFDLAELVHDVVHRLEAEARQRAVCLSVVCPGIDATALRVDADLRLIERVLHSLVENALRQTPAAGQVTIAFERTGSRVRVVVRDNGEGIAGELLDGERVDAADPRGHGGLDLAIARRIVQLHGGEIEVQSRPGQGTQVAFDLPLPAVEEQTGPAAPGP
jgi:signal transduction histidine kinase